MQRAVGLWCSAWRSGSCWLPAAKAVAPTRQLQLLRCASSQAAAPRAKHTATDTTTAATSAAAAAAAAADVSVAATPAAPATSSGSSSSTTGGSVSSSSSSRSVLLRVSPSDASQRFDRWLRGQLPAHARMPWARLAALLRTRVIRRARQTPVAVAADAAAPANAPAAAAKTKVKPLHTTTRMQVDDEILVPAWLVKGKSTAGSAPAASSSSSSSSPARCELTEEERRYFLQVMVIHEDNDLVIVNKPAGMPMTSSSPDQRHLSGLLWVLEEHAAHERAEFESKLAAARAAQPSAFEGAPPPKPLPPLEPFRIVRPLDKEVSGCVAIAKNRRTAEILSHLFQQAAADEDEHAREADSQTAPAEEPPYDPAVWSVPTPHTKPIVPIMQTRYVAIVHNTPTQPEGSLLSELPSGVSCRTSFRMLSSVRPAFPTALHTSYAFVELLPHTSQKRQLRKHCHSQLGCTVVGEQINEIDGGGVGGSGPVSPRQAQLRVRERMIHTYLAWTDPRPLPLFLHAHKLVLHHRDLHRGRPLIVFARVPTPFAQLLTVLFRPA